MKPGESETASQDVRRLQVRVFALEEALSALWERMLPADPLVWSDWQPDASGAAAEGRCTHDPGACPDCSDWADVPCADPCVCPSPCWGGEAAPSAQLRAEGVAAERARIRAAVAAKVQQQEEWGLVKPGWSDYDQGRLDGLVSAWRSVLRAIDGGRGL